jgi:hypothetical protein
MAKQTTRFPRTILSKSSREAKVSVVHFGDYIEVSGENADGVFVEEFTPQQERAAKELARNIAS